MQAIARGINENGYINEVRLDDRGYYLSVFISPDNTEGEDGEYDSFSVTPVAGFSGLWAAASHGSGAEPYSPCGFIQRGMTGYCASYRTYTAYESKTFSNLVDAVIWLNNLSLHHDYELEIDHIKKL